MSNNDVADSDEMASLGNTEIEKMSLDRSQKDSAPDCITSHSSLSLAEICFFICKMEMIITT